jgi:hypothetical protein
MGLPWGLARDEDSFSIPMEGIEAILQFKVIVSQESEDLDHPDWSEEGGQKFVKNADGLFWPFELGVTNSHPKFGFIQKRTLGEIRD